MPSKAYHCTQHMGTPLTITVDSKHISDWYFATTFVQTMLTMRVQELENIGLDATYYKLQLQRIEEMEMFFKMTWDDSIANRLAYLKEVEA